MTRKQLAQALRDDAQRCLDQISDEELLKSYNTCADCRGWILIPAQFAAIIGQAESLEEFHELFNEAREEDGHEWN
jgi:hypothetical protein